MMIRLLVRLWQNYYLRISSVGHKSCHSIPREKERIPRVSGGWLRNIIEPQLFALSGCLEQVGVTFDTHFDRGRRGSNERHRGVFFLLLLSPVNQKPFIIAPVVDRDSIKVGLALLWDSRRPALSVNRDRQPSQGYGISTAL